MENCFNSKKYLDVVIQNIKDKAEKTKGKLYVEVNWKLLEDDFAQRILPGYDTDNKKKMIIELKRELDILMCVNASAIIDNLPMTKKAIPCVQHLEHTLKRIETVTWIKPHLVITNTNPEEMYDIIYNFEIKFQKKWYKVWELYLKKGFPYNKEYLLSENGFWNDDHIPIMKKVALITGIGNGSWKLSTCIWQIYQDHEMFFIGRNIDYALCMEASLKMKEISYIHSEAYAAGELKHGTISLIENNMVVFGIVTNPDIAPKTISNLKETKARGSKMILVTTKEIAKNYQNDKSYSWYWVAMYFLTLLDKVPSLPI